jgi:hypothetical protein
MVGRHGCPRGGPAETAAREASELRWPQGDAYSDERRMNQEVATAESSTSFQCGAITRLHGFHCSELPDDVFAGSTEVIA